MKRILLDSSVHQTRIAVVENGELVELIYESKHNANIVGNIYCGRVSNVLPGMQAAFIDIGQEKNAYLYYGQKNTHCSENDNQVQKPKVGKEIVVQVEKAASGTKGAVVTRKISFPGKFLVLIPNDDEIGISKKITDSVERGRIREIAKILLPKNYGIIIRTNGVGKTKEDYKKEIDRLYELSESVLKKAQYSKAPCIIHSDYSPVIKAARELFSEDVDEFIISGDSEYNTLCELENKYGSETNKIIKYNSAVPIFENYFVESQAKKVLNKKVWLKSGGFLIIEQTEACVVIDVNTGKYVGKKDLQTTIIKTNLEAAVEIAKQLRLRNLSGMIIVDFIDLKSEEDKKFLQYTLEQAVNKDRTKTVVVGMTELGLMQITRKKTSPSLLNQMTRTCNCCGGTGRISALEYIVEDIRRNVVSIFNQTVFNKVSVFADERLLNAFAGKDSYFKNEMEKHFDKKIELVSILETDYGYYRIEREKI